ncbi:hypothetical protein CEUSTIGMA_g11668.t1 [Chlamydomonas eustigma]|uniref:Uncharacterized protein n=1 Tax=Chlamydomonas eustigma TaxID=1157962 RepID=A0A250XMC3_9CHLO|nr:hypothetical protein CEUSTIGMA_g11668.t1 [Chlamydomonas eustigma]|eukprot:GAX84245.1 hypothetical protein CEUSTIGMA_g11668.t1 [Chlamydomonas eustigma]
MLTDVCKQLRISGIMCPGAPDSIQSLTNAMRSFHQGLESCNNNKKVIKQFLKTWIKFFNKISDEDDADEGTGALNRSQTEVESDSSALQTGRPTNISFQRRCIQLGILNPVNSVADQLPAARLDAECLHMLCDALHNFFLSHEEDNNVASALVQAPHLLESVAKILSFSMTRCKPFMYGDICDTVNVLHELLGESQTLRMYEVATGNGLMYNLMDAVPKLTRKPCGKLSDTKFIVVIYSTTSALFNLIAVFMKERCAQTGLLDKSEQLPALSAGLNEDELRYLASPSLFTWLYQVANKRGLTRPRRPGRPPARCQSTDELSISAMANYNSDVSDRGGELVIKCRISALHSMCELLQVPVICHRVLKQNCSGLIYSLSAAAAAAAVPVVVRPKVPTTSCQVAAPAPARSCHHAGHCHDIYAGHDDCSADDEEEEEEETRLLSAYAGVIAAGLSETGCLSEAEVHDIVHQSGVLNTLMKGIEASSDGPASELTKSLLSAVQNILEPTNFTALPVLNAVVRKITELNLITRLETYRTKSFSGCITSSCIPAANCCQDESSTTSMLVRELASATDDALSNMRRLVDMSSSNTSSVAYIMPQLPSSCLHYTQLLHNGVASDSRLPAAAHIVPPSSPQSSRHNAPQCGTTTATTASRRPPGKPLTPSSSSPALRNSTLRGSATDRTTHVPVAAATTTTSKPPHLAAKPAAEVPHPNKRKRMLSVLQQQHPPLAHQLHFDSKWKIAKLLEEGSFHKTSGPAVIRTTTQQQDVKASSSVLWQSQQDCTEKAVAMKIHATVASPPAAAAGIPHQNQQANYTAERALHPAPPPQLQAASIHPACHVAKPLLVSTSSQLQTSILPSSPAGHVKLLASSSPLQASILTACHAHPASTSEVQAPILLPANGHAHPASTSEVQAPILLPATGHAHPASTSEVQPGSSSVHEVVLVWWEVWGTHHRGKKAKKALGTDFFEPKGRHRLSLQEHVKNGNGIKKQTRVRSNASVESIVDSLKGAFLSQSIVSIEYLETWAQVFVRLSRIGCDGRKGSIPELCLKRGVLLAIQPALVSALEEHECHRSLCNIARGISNFAEACPNIFQPALQNLQPCNCIALCRTLRLGIQACKRLSELKDVCDAVCAISPSLSDDVCLQQSTLTCEQPSSAPAEELSCRKPVINHNSSVPHHLLIPKAMVDAKLLCSLIRTLTSNQCCDELRQVVPHTHDGLCCVVKALETLHRLSMQYRRVFKCGAPWSDITSAAESAATQQLLVLPDSDLEVLSSPELFRFLHMIATSDPADRSRSTQLIIDLQQDCQISALLCISDLLILPPVCQAVLRLSHPRLLLKLSQYVAQKSRTSTTTQLSHPQDCNGLSNKGQHLNNPASTHTAGTWDLTSSGITTQQQQQQQPSAGSSRDVLITCEVAAALTHGLSEIGCVSAEEVFGIVNSGILQVFLQALELKPLQEDLACNALLAIHNILEPTNFSLRIASTASLTPAVDDDVILTDGSYHEKELIATCEKVDALHTCQRMSYFILQLTRYSDSAESQNQLLSTTAASALVNVQSLLAVANRLRSSSRSKPSATAQQHHTPASAQQQVHSASSEDKLMTPIIGSAAPTSHQHSMPATPAVRVTTQPDTPHQEAIEPSLKRTPPNGGGSKCTGLSSSGVKRVYNTSCTADLEPLSLTSSGLQAVNEIQKVPQLSMSKRRQLPSEDSLKAEDRAADLTAMMDSSSEPAATTAAAVFEVSTAIRSPELRNKALFSSISCRDDDLAAIGRPVPLMQEQQQQQGLPGIMGLQTSAKETTIMKAGKQLRETKETFIAVVEAASAMQHQALQKTAVETGHQRQVVVQADYSASQQLLQLPHGNSEHSVQQTGGYQTLHPGRQRPTAAGVGSAAAVDNAADAEDTVAAPVMLIISEDELLELEVLLHEAATLCKPLILQSAPIALSNLATSNSCNSSNAAAPATSVHKAVLDWWKVWSLRYKEAEQELGTDIFEVESRHRRMLQRHVSSRNGKGCLLLLKIIKVL